mgnify:CR=1 FL=1
MVAAMAELFGNSWINSLGGKDGWTFELGKDEVWWK